LTIARRFQRRVRVTKTEPRPVGTPESVDAILYGDDASTLATPSDAAPYFTTSSVFSPAFFISCPVALVPFFTPLPVFLAAFSVP
jgi:hypothetical protein